MRTTQEWQDRERELLETANRYLERARAAERYAIIADKAIEAYHKEIKHG